MAKLGTRIKQFGLASGTLVKNCHMSKAFLSPHNILLLLTPLPKSKWTKLTENNGVHSWASKDPYTPWNHIQIVHSYNDPLKELMTPKKSSAIVLAPYQSIFNENKDILLWNKLITYNALYHFQCIKNANLPIFPFQ